MIVDEVHAPLVPEGATFVPWFAVADHGFVVTSAAKAFNLAGLKAGLIVSGPASRAQLKRLPDSVAYGGSHLGVIGHSAAATGRTRPGSTPSTRTSPRTGRCWPSSSPNGCPGCVTAIPEATYLAWLDLRGVGLGQDPAEILIERGRVALTAGRPFGRGGIGHARVNLACSQEVLTEAVDRMVAAVAAHAAQAGGHGT